MLGHKERVAQMKRDVLKSYVCLAREGLSLEEHNQIYALLRLQVSVKMDSTLEIDEAPVEGDGTCTLEAQYRMR